MGRESLSALFLAGKLIFGVIAEQEIVIIPVPLSALFVSSVWCIPAITTFSPLLFVCEHTGKGVLCLIRVENGFYVSQIHFHSTYDENQRRLGLRFTIFRFVT